MYVKFTSIFDTTSSTTSIHQRFLARKPETFGVCFAGAHILEVLDSDCCAVGQAQLGGLGQLWQSPGRVLCSGCRAPAAKALREGRPVRGE